MVQFLYRGDYRRLSEFIDQQHPPDPLQERDLVAGSLLFGPWDKVALQTDCACEGVRVRWVNPERALVFPAGGAALAYLQDEGARDPFVAGVLAVAQPAPAPEGMQGYRVPMPKPPDTAIRSDMLGANLADQAYAGALQLLAVDWQPGSAPSEQQARAVLWWQVVDELPLPSEELIPHPPPPGVYNGPRLKVYAHVTSGERLVSVDDGLWVDPYSLETGDVVVQVHVFNIGDDEEPGVLRIGLYDPLDGKRWTTAEGSDELAIRLKP
jgi:hypothetical protein